MTTKNMEARREAFEKWLDSTMVSTRYDSPFKLGNDGSYFHNRINARWIAWNAALDSICVELPQGFTHHGGEDCTKYVIDADEVVEALTAAGVPYK